MMDYAAPESMALIGFASKLAEDERKGAKVKENIAKVCKTGVKIIEEKIDGDIATLTVSNDNDAQTMRKVDGKWKLVLIKDNKKSLFDDVSVKTVLSSSALMDFQAPQYMRGMVGGDLQSIKGLDLDAVQDSRRRRLVMEEMTNTFVADKKSGDSYIAGSVRDMKRMNTAHSDMMQIRKKKIKSKTKNRKVKKNVNND